MAEKDELLDFYLQLESEITDLARANNGNSGGDFRESAFAGLVAEELEESGVLETPEICHYESGSGSGSMKINGYGVPEEDSRLDLLVAIYNGPGDGPETINSAEIEIAFNRLARFLNNSLSGLQEKLDPALGPYRMSEQISSLRERIDRVNLFLFTNARLAVRSEKRRKSQVCGFPATYEIWDLERLRRLRESGSSYEALNVDLTGQTGGGLPAVRLDTGQDGFRTWVTVFPGPLLSDLYGEYGSRLLELNVRSYLQARGKVNQGILETLRYSPGDFMAYNNGITVVAENVVAGAGDRITELQGMQIVNGGQTTASMHRAATEFGADLSKVFVQAKITVVEAGRFQEVVPRISEYSNTQNKVTTSDLSANHVFHVGMERVSEREWSPDQKTQWFYERTRGSYQTAKSRKGTTPARRREFENRYPAQQRFTKEDLAKFENTWLSLPHVVSRGAQKNFVNFMGRIPKLPDGWEPQAEEFRRYIAKGILFRDGYRIVRSLDKITAHWVNVSAYTVALLTEKTVRRINLDRIWREQAISDGLRSTIESWAPVVFEHLPVPAERSGKNVSESFKSQATWEYIRSLNLVVPVAVEEELVLAVDGRVNEEAPSGKPKAILSAQDHNNIAKCRELTEADWLKIATWARESGVLQNWQKGIARTLAGYAADGWQQLPSQKQAKHGVTIIEEARSHGVF